MKTQGEAIRHVVSVLEQALWKVPYFSMPNTAHAGVVPIPTVTPGAKQRYPDVVATKSGVLLLAEIEPRLTSAIEREIVKRFENHDAALEDRSLWHSWSSRVREVTGVEMPSRFSPRHQLVVCQMVEHRFTDRMEIIPVDYYVPPET